MLKFLLEIIPLIAFLIGYKKGGMVVASIYVMISALVTVTISYIRERKLSSLALISSSLLLVSSGLTVISGNPVFIKMKPTILYCIFAVIFLTTTYKGTPAARYIIGHAVLFKEERYWKMLNIRFVPFFLLMAVLNEFVWRNFSESTWVNFKVFGAVPLTIVFMLMQLPFLMRYKISAEDK